MHTGSGAADALPMIGYSILSTAVMLLGVSRLLRPLARHVGRQGTLSPGVMYVVAIVPIVCGYLTDRIGIYSVFGGFIAGLAMKTLRFSWREAFAVGGLMKARGMMIIIFINIGLAQGLITKPVFSVLVMVAVITSTAALPLYRRALPKHLEMRSAAKRPLRRRHHAP